MSRIIAVSSRHSVSLNDEYLSMIDRAPREDFVVRTLAHRKAGNMTLMLGELVIASAATREAFEPAQQYPLHFRKTYYPGTMYGDPVIEFARHQRASELIDLPPPIGATRSTFRSCLLPGSPLNRLCELGVVPDERNIVIAQELSLAAAAGLWRLTEEALTVLGRLQEQGLTHGDAHLHNFILCPSPLEVLPIDFENAILKEDVSEDAWQQRCRADRSHLLRLMVFLQCALGHQHGALAAEALQVMDELVEPAGKFRQHIAEHSFDTAIPA